MSCLFCDQTPETLNAREKLAMAAKLLNCSLINVLISIQSLLTENGYLKMGHDSLLRDRDQWRDEAHKAQRQAKYYNYNASKLPAVYTERWGQVFDEGNKPVAVPKFIAPLITDLEALPKGKK